MGITLKQQGVINNERIHVITSLPWMLSIKRWREGQDVEIETCNEFKS
jgi:hypothetical protein